MIPGLISSLPNSVRGYRFPAVKTSSELLKSLPDSPLKIIIEYLLAGDLKSLTRLCGRVKHLAFHSSPEGFEALWTSLYERDYPSSMVSAKNLLARPKKGFSAWGALECSSMWPATRADVLAQLYPARLSTGAYDRQQVLRRHTLAVIDITQLTDGRIAAASHDGRVCIWPLNGGEPRVLTGHNMGGVARILQLADGRLASASYDRTVRICSLDGGVPRVFTGHTSDVRQITQLADGSLASASNDNKVRIWSLDGDNIHVFANHYMVKRLAGDKYAVVSSDHAINVYSLGAPLGRSLIGHTDSVRHIIQLANGRIASGSRDGMICIQSLDGSGYRRVLRGHNGEVLRLMQLFDGSIASASSDGSIRIWSLEGDVPCRVLTGHNSRVNYLIQLFDGSIASASNDNTVRIWSLNGGVPHRVLTGHTRPVMKIVQLVDGRIASASYDGTIRIWGPDTNQLVRTATRQARCRKVMHKVSRKAILALGFVLLAWGVNVLFKTIVRGSTHTPLSLHREMFTNLLEGDF